MRNLIQKLNQWSLTILITSFIRSILLAGIFLSVACSSQKYNPSFWHQLYVEHLQAAVGRSFSGESNGWAQSVTLIGQSKLASGHIAYKYRDGGTCQHTLEVDDKTDTIVAVDWQGDKRDCFIIP